MWSSSLCNFLHSPITLFLIRTLFSNTLSLCSPLMWEIKFHTHIKELSELWFYLF
jgi:hypothetical protein